MLYSFYKRVNASVAQLVERHLAKVNVVGSSPITRSICFKRRCNLYRFFYFKSVPTMNLYEIDCSFNLFYRLKI